ncbi:glutamate--cysteine ligase catalytic subunit [Cyclospora cayetanensis]|uniref:Glutamate--cysteine ligase n=1 Tax=Cyclospora cayetanensis TaxID=88456 RepID=A0A6P6RWK5_9EIME|nr:glutamate--cysteine ligase catalytic subunit [Cyclospora cayetanensis]
MGFLGVGEPLDWHSSLLYQAAVKRRGIRQFLQLLKQFKDYEGPLKWGDEIEVFLVRVDPSTRQIRLALDAGPSILKMKASEAAATPQQHQEGENITSSHERSLWHPEYASYMIEALPGAALNLQPESWLLVEQSIRSRRRKLLSCLEPHTSPLFMTSFPLLGVDVQPRENSGGNDPSPGNFAYPASPADPLHSLSQSIFLGDEVINPHPRFGTLTANIRRRRGCKVQILVPLYMDRGVCVDTSRKVPNQPLFDAALGGRQCILYHDEEGRDSQSGLAKMHEDQALINQGNLYIYMDAMCFGMGMNCVQATFSCKTISDARYLYDQLIVVAPLVLSLTAATPFLRGCVAATDTRWDSISMAVDSRRADEMKSIIKSRYSANSLYISDKPHLFDRLGKLNDLELTVNERAYDALVRSGVDSLLARHVALLFVHDPLVIFKDRVMKEGQTEGDIIREGDTDWGMDDGIVYETAEDFENLQSTNWNAVRFKPPPQFMRPTSSDLGDTSLIGWRVELRTPEIQLTDFENAACISLIAAVVQLILEEQVELYIPISLNDINMQRAAKLNSILNQRFWFRRDIRANANDLSYAEFSLHSILFGEAGPADTNVSDAVFGPALLRLCKQMFEGKVRKGHCSAEALNAFMEMYNLTYLRTSGELPTDAAFLRACLSAHPEYRGDSVISPGATYDICQLAMRLGNGELEIAELLGPFARRYGSAKARTIRVSNNCTSSCASIDPEALLLGKGRIAASLQHPDIHERLRLYMLQKPAVSQQQACARSEGSCSGISSAQQQCAFGEQMSELASAEFVGSE